MHCRVIFVHSVDLSQPSRECWGRQLLMCWQLSLLRQFQSHKRIDSGREMGNYNYNWGTVLAWLQVRGYEEHKTQRTIQLHCIWINWVLLHHCTNVGDTHVAGTLWSLLFGQVDILPDITRDPCPPGAQCSFRDSGEDKWHFSFGQGWLVRRKNRISLHSFECPFRMIKSYHTLTLSEIVQQYLTM